MNVPVINTTNSSVDTEFLILENIYSSLDQDTPLRQRDLALVAGTSLGMTNSILKRLAQKGWISAKKLNRRKIQYAVTIDGINELLRRSYRYFKRTIRNIMIYKDAIDRVINQARRKNFAVILLIGVSDLEFIIEHGCHNYGLSFLKTVDTATARQALDEKTFGIFAETIPENRNAGKKDPANTLYLSRLVMGGMPNQELP
ncbi:MAG: MarR family transcriptional regulator [Treponema sp.]|jgi:DNA-binding MarR family transcriptional regulator|nr:MarR family transcriptional regulator [Treponema sp.]